ncbi:MAG: hypothetical protein WC333_00860 [Dehalococcoidia bacterium]|jgi:hypothetical protein
MSRNKGTFNFAANFEGLLKAPIDARQMVCTYADLTLPATWSGSSGIWLYDGAVVSVATGANSGIYWLCDSANYTNASSWIKAGSGSGTLTGATNGLSLVNNGTLVSLGGDLTGDTTINGVGLWDVNLSNVDGFNVSTSGSTTEIILEPAGITLSYAGSTVSLDSSGGLTYGGHYPYNEYSLVDKQYVDAIASGLLPKGAVCVATTTNISYPFSGLTTIDGIPLSNGDRVLIKDQTPSGQTNGIWVVNSGGTWTRSTDFDGIPTGETMSGSYMWVLTGLTNAQSSWVLITPDPVYIHDITGSTLTFALYDHVKDVTAGTGITVTTITGTHIISLNAATQATLAVAITGVTNSGGGESVYSGTSGHNIILNTIIGSGNTSVSKVGNEIVIFTSGGTEIYDLASPSICATGGMCVGTVLTGKTAIQILQEILVPELCGVLTPPSFSTTLAASTTYYEIGCTIPSLSVCGTFNRGCINPQYMSTSDKRVGCATCYVYTGAQVAGTYITSACTISQPVTSYVVIGTPEVWGITVCYSAGVQPLGQNGTPFNSACPAGSLSDSKTICGVYPIFATTSAIGTMTKQSYVAMTTTPVTLILVAESGGLKDRFEIPNAWTGNPLKCICTYNTFSSAWEWEGGSGAASLTTWTPSVSSETLCCGSAPYCLYTYNGACRLTTTCIRLVF